jgi:hypothetical protein
LPEFRTVGIRRSGKAEELLLAPVGRASRYLGRAHWVRPEWRCRVSFRMIEVPNQFGEKVPGEARWHATCLLVCTRVFAHRETVT